MEIGQGLLSESEGGNHREMLLLLRLDYGHVLGDNVFHPLLFVLGQGVESEETEIRPCLGQENTVDGVDFQEGFSLVFFPEKGSESLKVSMDQRLSFGHLEEMIIESAERVRYLGLAGIVVVVYVVGFMRWLGEGINGLVSKTWVLFELDFLCPQSPIGYWLLNRLLCLQVK